MCANKRICMSVCWDDSNEISAAVKTMVNRRFNSLFSSIFFGKKQIQKNEQEIFKSFLIIELFKQTIVKQN